MAFFGDVDRVTTSRNCDDEELAIDLVGGRKDEEGVEAGESGPSDAGAGSPPIVAWSPAAQAQAAASEGGVIRPKLLVLGLAGAGAAYCHATFSGRSRVGAIQLPSVTRAGDSLGGDALTDNVCTVHTLADGDFSVLVARCQYAVPTASAPLWADAVFKAVQPDRVIVLDALEITPAEAAELPRGSTGRVRVLKTDAVAPEELAAVDYVAPPYLAGGLCASIVTHCQVFGIPAAAFMALQVRGINAALLGSFDAAWKAAGAWVGVSAVAAAVPSGAGVTVRSRFAATCKVVGGDPLSNTSLYL